MDRPEFPRVLLVERLPEGTAEEVEKLLAEFKQPALSEIFIDEPSLGDRTRLVQMISRADPNAGPLQAQLLCKTAGRKQALDAFFIADAPASRFDPIVEAVGIWFKDYILKLKEYRDATEEKKDSAGADGQARSSEETSAPGS